MPTWLRYLMPMTVSFLLGFGIHWAILSLRTPYTTHDHWRIVNEYRECLLNPDSASLVKHSNLLGATLTDSPEPSLFALVNSGELEYVDIVFPNVLPRSGANSYWMNFCSKSSSVLHAVGNREYTYYNTTGEQPLRLSLWFKPEARSDVQQLIKDIDEKYGSSQSP